MGKIFYDNLVKLTKVEEHINKIADTNEEKQEMWAIVDSIVHHKMMDTILQNLREELHQEFVEKFSKSPHDESHFDYLTKHIGQDVRTFLRFELERLTVVILEELRSIVEKPVNKS